jgi:hypothetical protein
VAQRFTAAIGDLFSMTASAAEGKCRVLHEFFSNLFSLSLIYAFCSAQIAPRKIHACAGLESNHKNQRCFESASESPGAEGDSSTIARE